MESYSITSILYWLGLVDVNGDITYKLNFKGDIEIVSCLEFEDCIRNTTYLCYPTICLN